MSWLGLDIGGANLKLADGLEFAFSKPFPLWQEPTRLGDELRALIAQAPVADHIAVTMTGELCDCFATKTEGVLFILDEVERAVDGRHTRVYAVDGRWLSIAAARRDPLAVAASNWHALAQFAARYIPNDRTGLLIDVGSTTIDLIRLGKQGPITTSRSDLDRLRTGELLYTGVIRSPVCAVVQSVPFRSEVCSIAHEFFATMRDVYLLLGELPEVASDCDTADHRPATRIAARNRMARLLCAESPDFHHRDAVVVAEAARAAQLNLLAAHIRRLLVECSPGDVIFVISGVGEFLTRMCLRQIFPSIDLQVQALSESVGARISMCGPAYALAVLAREKRSAITP